ncbi:thymidylate synthase [Lysinibacillus endophyticus]|uniref:Thymidylate synthase n=1 Tax=Ureibacillus endophyticus TaxID=1978490 RepID=A0A494Z0C7_9BACL|nr:thymidylate synthase [Lysinibacillus endophyticus]MCP1144417.1 thymidylate synthase [Lysinibacillus endophyticus]RKQ15983.1 thymidylate synthase [Lysinibacillus endophyticus]
MNVIFVLTKTGEEVLEMVSNDVAGLLAAVKGENVTFPFGSFKYDFHTLDHYLVDNVYRQELVIYLKEESETIPTLPTI